jgi:hypothetical protein
MKYYYYLESYSLGKRLKFKEYCSLQYGQGWLDARKDHSPRPHMRLVRSDGKIIEEVPANHEVSIGMVAGWPTPEQYERAAQKALETAKHLREKQKH